MANPHPKSNLPRDADGKIIRGVRPKGVPNKMTQEAKQCIAWAYEGIGGVEKMIAWATKEEKTFQKELNENGEEVVVKHVDQPNLKTFYADIYTKLIPVQVGGTVHVTDQRGSDAQRAIESAFYKLIDDKQSASERAAVVIDAEPIRGVIPELVVSSKK